MKLITIGTRRYSAGPTPSGGTWCEGVRVRDDLSEDADGTLWIVFERAPDGKVVNTVVIAPTEAQTPSPEALAAAARRLYPSLRAAAPVERVAGSDGG